MITKKFQNKSYYPVADALPFAIDPTQITVESRLSYHISPIKIHRRRTLMSLIVLFMIALAAVTPCRAQEYSAGDWIPFKPGTSVLLGYYGFATSSHLNNTIAGEVPHSNLNADIGIARVMHYEKFLGHTVAIQAIVPFGSLNNAKIGGQHLRNASGGADPIIATGMWFIDDPKHNRYFSFLDYIPIPIGTYDKHSTLNLGSNRWQNDLQVNYTEIFRNKIMVDVSGSWFHAGDNHEAGTGNQTLKQDETFGGYYWVGYNVTSWIKRPETLPAWLSVGYSETYRGDKSLDGIHTGEAAGAKTIKMSYSQFITPKWQALIQVSHDVDTRGQFQQKVGMFVRIARVF